MTLRDFEDLVKRLVSDDLPPPQIVVTQSSEPELTPDIIGRWVRQVAPLAEAEKVLKDWLERVGGIVYADGAMHLQWGYWAQSNRKGFEGINLYPEPPGGKKSWSTYAQFLEFALEYARQTIGADEHAAGYKSAVVSFTEELINLGVDRTQIDDALVAMGIKLENTIKADNVD